MLLASKPRSAIDEAPGVKPAPLLEVGTPFGPATVKFRTNSAVVRSPRFLDPIARNDVDRIRSYFLSGRDIRASNNNALRFGVGFCRSW